MEQPRSEENDSIQPLEGEQGLPSVHAQRSGGVSGKMIFGAVVLIASVAVGGYAMLNNPRKAAEKAAELDAKSAPKSQANVKGALRPATLAALPDGAPRYTQELVESQKVPAIEEADPIGLKAEGGGSNRAKQDAPSPYDSPALLPMVSNTEMPESASAARNPSGGRESPEAAAARQRLSTLQTSLDGMMSTLNKTAQGGSEPTVAAPPPAPGLGGQLIGAGTPRIYAGELINRSLTLPKGGTFGCALKTRIVSEQSGFVSCQLLRNVYSDDGRVLLLERGAHMDGEYTARYRQGQTRIFVIWTRVRTPNGVTVDIESPATGQLGEAGVDGYVDNHWLQRFGGALLVTLIDSAVKVSVAKQQSGTAVVAGDSGDTMAKVAEKMLDSTINMPPTIYKNQGEVVGIYVSKDVDFSRVYELAPKG